MLPAPIQIPLAPAALPPAPGAPPNPYPCPDLEALPNPFPDLEALPRLEFCPDPEALSLLHILLPPIQVHILACPFQEEVPVRFQSVTSPGLAQWRAPVRFQSATFLEEVPVRFQSALFRGRVLVRFQSVRSLELGPG